MKRLATILGAVLALSLLTVAPATANGPVDDLYVKTTVNGNVTPANIANPDRTTFCHRTANVGHWVMKNLKSAEANGHLTGTDKNHNKPVNWNGVEVEDFIPSQWQIENRTCGPKPPVDPPCTGPDCDLGGPGIFVGEIHVCGDPKVIWVVTNNGDETSTFNIRFVSARYGAVKKPELILAAGATKVIKRCVAGRTAIWAEDENGRFVQSQVNRANNEGACRPLSFYR